MSDQKIKIGITLGDVNGIGPEVVLKTFADTRMAEMCIPVIYGSGAALGFYKKSIEGGEAVHYTVVKNANEARAKQFNLIDCMGDGFQVEPGVPSQATGKAALAALRKAVADITQGAIDVLVTAPINKETIQGEGFDFTGHTEFLAAELGGEPLMMMCSEALRVGLVTTHLPLGEVAGSITQEAIVKKLELLAHSLTADFSIVKPRIAVLALNPHSGDGGLLGEQEKTVIKPAIVEAVGKGILVFGPFAADGFFASAAFRQYDAVLAMYHDQGLTPFKALTPEGVNFTAGLKYVRTSPDHGTAYDIAGQDKADPASMREAIYLALDILRSRKEYAEMTKNPLQHFEREKSHKDLSVKDLLPEEGTSSLL